MSIEPAKILGAYHDKSILMDEEMPEMTEDGFGLGTGGSASTYGPWDIYMQYDLAVAFVNKYPNLEDDDGNKLEAMAYRVMPEQIPNVPSSIASGPTFRPLLVERAGWIELSLASGEEFQVIHSKDVIKALQDMNLRVYRGSRSQAKVLVEGEMIPLGEGARTGKLNFVVEPKTGRFENFDWPGLSPVTGQPRGIPVISDLTGLTYEIKYRIGGDGASGMHGEYTQCKKLAAECTSPSFCAMEGRERSQKLYQARKSATAEARREERGSKRTAAEERKEKVARAKASFLSTRLKPSEVDCDHLTIGQCHRGTKCKFRHAPTEAPRDGSYVKDWEDIECGVTKRLVSGKCDAYPNCIYSPCATNQRAERTGASSNSLVMPAQHTLHAPTPHPSHG